MRKNLQIFLTTFVVGIVLQISPASASMISYSLSDKGPGAIADPDYGLRLDDLFSRRDTNWTFSFDDPFASMQMDIDTTNQSVHIHGTVIGGRDIGSAWESKSLWNLDFLYNDGITIDDAINGFWTVDYNANNYGYMELLRAEEQDLDGLGGSDIGKFLALGDFHGGSFFDHTSKGPYVSAWLESTRSFILTNENLANNNFNRPNGGGCCMDFGFQADRVPVPEPSIIALFAAGLFGIGFARRKKHQ